MKRIWRFLRTTLLVGAVVALVAVGFMAYHPFMNKYHEVAAKWQTQQFAGWGQGDKRGAMQQPQPPQLAQGDKRGVMQQPQPPQLTQGDTRGAMQQPGFANGDMRRAQQPLVLAKGDSQRYAAGRDDNRFEQSRKVSHMGAFRGERGHRDFGERGLGGVLGGLLLLVAGIVLRKRGGRVARRIGTVMIAIALLPLLFIALHVIIPAAIIFFIVRRIRRCRRGCRAAADSEAFAPTVDLSYTPSTVDYLDEWEAKTRRQLKQKEQDQKEEE